MRAYAAAVTGAVCARLQVFMHSCVPRKRATRHGACVVGFAVLEGFASVWVDACEGVQAQVDEPTSLRRRFKAGIRASTFGERRSICLLR